MASFAVVFDGRARTSAIRKRASDATVLMMFNAYHDGVEFTLPDITGPDGWLRLIDTNLPLAGEPPARYRCGDQYTVTGRSTVIMVQEVPGADSALIGRLERIIRGS